MDVTFPHSSAQSKLSSVQTSRPTQNLVMNRQLNYILLIACTAKKRVYTNRYKKAAPTCIIIVFNSVHTPPTYSHEEDLIKLNVISLLFRSGAPSTCRIIVWKKPCQTDRQTYRNHHRDSKN